MLAKLSADILDKLDVFILEIEELQIPQVSMVLSSLTKFSLNFSLSPFGGNIFGVLACYFHSGAWQQSEKIKVNH